MTKLLVLTALEETWGTLEELVFLGPWCTIYDRSTVWKQRNYEILPFHWDDRYKLQKDYDYLEKLHQTLLIKLTELLNQYHRVNHSLRYWQMLIDPWLMSYVGVLFDRWEHIRLAFEKYPLISSKSTLYNLSPCFSYNEFIKDVCCDQWNQALYENIINHRKSLMGEQKKVNQSCNTAYFISISNQKDSSFYTKALHFLGSHIAKLQNKYSVIFLNSYFNFKALIRLNIFLKQVPQLFRKKFYYPALQHLICSLPIHLSDRGNLCLTMQPSNTFEQFLLHRIILDLPTCLLEHYYSILHSINKEKFTGKLVFTGSEHWGNIFAKFWFAKHINNQGIFAVLEHGGSLPAYKELFNFEENISDFKITWFTPYHPKHIQLPPPKLIYRFPKNCIVKKITYRKKYLSIIGNECSRWVFRCHFYPMSTQCLISFDLVLRFFESLDKDIKKFCKIKPYPNQGINTKQRFEDTLGKKHLFTEARLDKVLFKSKIIVCTYPETTFSEAMATGIPTIILFPANLYERHPSTHSLLEQLYHSKIAFNNPIAAAQHINKIWRNPLDWWESHLVKKTRHFFYESALAKANDRPIQTWTELLTKILNQQTTIC